ncbi:hypothetical protein [Agrobacterium rosae]|uniref:hypothetical protein n=1 Tax=Agrobacterium rosae TaxID=1972867 RepID=UPI000CD84025|nr:hypothetical protein [Agrobacterium rosae]POO52094.1 hypothetical protein CTT39_21730 [Agrobacterium rosae]
MSNSYPDTPDGRYFVVKERLWRRSNPALDGLTRTALVKDLMAARRAVRDASAGSSEMKEAREKVDAAKVALGERGPVWWNDGAPDFNRHLARNHPYAAWFKQLEMD